MYLRVLLSSVVTFDHVLPASDAPLAEEVDPHLFHKFDHLQFGDHLAPAAHYTLDAVAPAEQSQAPLPDSLVPGFVLVEGRQGFQRRRPPAKLVDLPDFLRQQFVNQFELAEVTHQQGLEIYAEFHRVIFAALVHLLVQLDLFPFELNPRRGGLRRAAVLLGGSGRPGVAVVGRRGLLADLFEGGKAVGVKKLNLHGAVEGGRPAVVVGVKRVGLRIFCEFNFTGTPKILVALAHPI